MTITADGNTATDAAAWAAHRQAVERLRDSYRRIPQGQTVRLAKKTSNLFRQRRPVGSGLEVGDLNGVIAVDPAAMTADVQGVCTYERLTEATLPYGLMPLVVPQLKTITLGGAVTGLGIESTSFRNGLPHESVTELDILTGAGEVVTARRSGPHSDLFYAFPNSYGSLGYATRLRIELQRIGAFVKTRNLRFDDIDELLEIMAAIIADRAYRGEPVDALDGVVFGPREAYLVLAQFDCQPGPTSDYGGQEIFYRSLRRRTHDHLSANDYLWRWDTDWFWCSRPFGAQHPLGRRLWPRRLRRSDTWHKIVTLENRYKVWARYERLRGRPENEAVIQDVELPLGQTAEFLRWFLRTVPLCPVWLCPVRLREQTDRPATSWPLYALNPGESYVNVGFWGRVPIEPGRSDGDVNRMIERRVQQQGGHKSLYSDVYYDRTTFDRLYGGDVYRAVKAIYDPDNRLTDMYEKAVGA